MSGLSDPKVRRLAPFGAAIVAMVLALLIPVPHEKPPQLASTPAPVPASAAPTPTGTPTVSVPSVPPRTGGGSSPTPPSPATNSTPPPKSPASNPPLASPPPELPPGQEPPPPAPCNTQAALDAIDNGLTTADTVTAGIVPANYLSTLIAIAAKCSDDDPATALLGLVNELGQGLPDLGLPGLPILPPLTLPPQLVDLLAALGVLTEPVCGQLGTAGTLLLVVSGNYPEPLASTMSNLAFEVLGPCTQLHPPN